jgi:hypothetical protein
MSRPILLLDHIRDRYVILLDGTEHVGGQYEAAQVPFPLTQSGETRGISGQLYALVPAYPGDVDAESQQQVVLGWASARYYVEDRVLLIQGPDSPALDEHSLVELSTLFVKRRFPDAATLYRFQTMGVIEYAGESRLPRLGYVEADERVLRRLGYRLLSENRRRPDGAHNRSSGTRTWTK